MPSEDGHGLANIGDRLKEVASTVVGLTSGATMGASSAHAYVTNAEVSDTYVVEAAQVAQERSPSLAIRELAERLRRDHTSTRAALRRDAGRHDDATPFSLDERHKGLIEILAGTEPKSFDAVFLHQMTAAHTEALTMQGGYVQRGDDPQYRQLAETAVPVLEQHMVALKEAAEQLV